MKKYLLIAFALFLTFLGQTVLSRYFLTPISNFDLFLILAVYYSLKEDAIKATFVGTAAGLVQDAFSSTIIGLNGFSKTIIAFFISAINARIILNHPLTQIAVLFLATLLNGLILKGLSFFFGLKYNPELFPLLFYQAGGNGAVGIIIFRLIFFYRQRGEHK